MIRLGRIFGRSRRERPRGIRGCLLLQVQEQEPVLGRILVEAGQRQARVGVLRRSQRERDLRGERDQLLGMR